MCMFVILLVRCLLVIQCSCHWSQLKATYLLTLYLRLKRVTIEKVASILVYADTPRLGSINLRAVSHFSSEDGCCMHCRTKPE